ncbi:MAG: formyltransferase [Burkholderiales bacterium]
MTVAVVFAYHDVGVGCLETLLDCGVKVPLVVSHRDDPGENIFFASVAKLSADKGIECIFPEDPNTSEIIERVRALQPDFLFSFYYRRMLKPELLKAARRGAFNMHGSLLPKYRGRAPVNWAVLHGEQETGATLHEMVEKPDAGRLVDQQAVPIGPDDTAGEVFARVTLAAQTVARRAIPKLIDGSAVLIPQDLRRGSYFGGRKPEDGRINWLLSAQVIHNLVRAVAPPYPGAFTPIGDSTLKILKTRLLNEKIVIASQPAMQYQKEYSRLVAQCGDSSLLQIQQMQWDNAPFTPDEFLSRFGPHPLPLTFTPPVL